MLSKEDVMCCGGRRSLRPLQPLQLADEQVMNLGRVGLSRSPSSENLSTPESCTLGSRLLTLRGIAWLKTVLSSRKRKKEILQFASTF